MNKWMLLKPLLLRTKHLQPLQLTKSQAIWRPNSHTAYASQITVDHPMSHHSLMVQPLEQEIPPVHSKLCLPSCLSSFPHLPLHLHPLHSRTYPWALPHTAGKIALLSHDGCRSMPCTMDVCTLHLAAAVPWRLHSLAIPAPCPSYLPPPPFYPFLVSRLVLQLHTFAITLSISLLSELLTVAVVGNRRVHGSGPGNSTGKVYSTRLWCPHTSFPCTKTNTFRAWLEVLMPLIQKETTHACLDISWWPRSRW